MCSHEFPFDVPVFAQAGGAVMMAITEFLGLFFLLVLLFIIIAPIVVWVRVNETQEENRKLKRDANRLDRRVDELERELRRLAKAQEQPANTKAVEKPKESTEPIIKPSAVDSMQEIVTRREAEKKPEPKVEAEPKQVIVPPLPKFAKSEPKVSAPAASSTQEKKPVDALKVESPKEEDQPLLARMMKGEDFNWEQFLGVKFFAWVGGLVAFLGVVFAIKYSFEQGWISPTMRVIGGVLTGIGLIVGAFRLPREKYFVTVHSLCASGVLTLYGSVYAAHAFYEVVPDVGIAFMLMAVVSATAFILSINLNSHVVAVLGIVGGFLTPVLLSTGEDRTVAFFGYILVLNAGLIAVSLKQRWGYLMALGAAGTAIMQLGWAGEFFSGERTYTAMTIFGLFIAQFLGAFLLARKREQLDKYIEGAALTIPGIAMCFMIWLGGSGPSEIADQAWPICLFLMSVNSVVIFLAWLRPHLSAGVLLGTSASALAQFCWVQRCFEIEHLHMTMVILLVHSAAYLGLAWFTEKKERIADECGWAALIFPALAMFESLLAFTYPLAEVTTRPGVSFGFVFLIDAVLIAVAWLRPQMRSVQVFAGGASFFLLAYWIAEFLNNEMLFWALGFTIVFGVGHTISPVLMERLRPAKSPVWWTHLFPPAALLMTLLPFFKLEQLSWAVWPVVILMDALAMGVAVILGSLVGFMWVFVITFFMAAVWIFRMPAEVGGLMGEFGMLVVVIGFAVIFFGAACAAMRWKIGTLKFDMSAPAKEAGDEWAFSGKLIGELAATSAIMPFLLLIPMVLRLPLENPSWVFLIGTGLCGMLLATTRWLRFEWLALVTLGCVLTLEFVWFVEFDYLKPSWLGFAWHLLFAGMFVAFPLIRCEGRESSPVIWATAALAIPLHFPMLLMTFTGMLPQFPVFGLLPALLSLPLIVVAVRLYRIPESEAHRNANLAWMGGAALFLITLVFPVQFEEQWLTLAWALEGAALTWLFRKVVPHEGLKLVGFCLLTLAFTRLALNPMVLGYERSGAPIFNWYLWVYGAAIASMIGATRMLAQPNDQLRGTSVLPWLYSMAGVLAFLLLNIEIADFFTGEGALRYNPSGSLGQDMSYSLGWGVFAMCLMGLGFRTGVRAARRVGIGLLLITIFKLFFHDLRELEGLYRVGSLIGLAIVLGIVSFFFQKMIAADKEEKSAEAKAEDSSQKA
ncbi:MAG: hypothetical protein CMO80_24715 [Verrucomicrobiales bacterium]|nr:hypothetical protein [Verrucomicrobiales bacterium]